MARWRMRYDDSAARGMPAHITALYPFLPEDRLSDPVLAELRELCSELPLLDVVFRRIRRFPDVLYLDPEPAADLRRLTLAIARRWPETPPYGGDFSDVVPHLTVAQRASDEAAASIEADLRCGLPFRTRLADAAVYGFDGTQWRLRVRLPFGGRHDASA